MTARLAGTLDELLALIRGVGLPEPEQEVRFWPGRRFAFDLAWPSRRVAVEFEGGVYQSGGGWHQSVQRYQSDCLKYSEAAVRGWVVIRLTPRMVQDGTALDLIQRALSVEVA